MQFNVEHCVVPAWFVAPSQHKGNEYVFPRTVDEHVVPVVDVVPVNETGTSVHVDSHEPATLYPVVLAHVIVFFN